MAFSSIIQRAQIFYDDLSCELCDTKSKINWKCSQCNQVICNQCKAIHMRSTVSRGHSLLPLSEMDDPLKVGLANPASNTISNCHKHPYEIIQMFCKDCKDLVCIDCIIEQHQGHNFAKLAVVAMEMKQELLMQASAKKKTVNNLEISIQSLDNQKRTYSKEIEELIKQRQSQADRLKSEIDTITNDLITDLKKREKRDIQEMDKNRLKLEASKMTLQDFVNTDQKTLQDMGNVATIRVAMEMKKLLDIPESSLSATLLKTPQLTVNLDEKRCLREIIGFVDDGDINRTENKVECTQSVDFTILDSMRSNLEILSKFTPEITTSRIYPISDSKAWIGNYCTDLLLVTIEGVVEKRVRTEFDVYDFASNSHEDLFITQYNGCTVHKLKDEGSCSLVADTSPLRTRGISVNKDNNILVVLTDTCGSGEKLIKLTNTGETVQTIAINSTPSILRPSLIQESSKMDICVLDSRKAVVVMDRDGKVKFEHTGLHDMEEFAPRGVACDRFGNIVVSDSKNLAIYLLNREGKFLKYIITKEDGLQAPHKISLDNSGQLWIADWNKIKVIRYT